MRIHAPGWQTSEFAFTVIVVGVLVFFAWRSHDPTERHICLTGIPAVTAYYGKCRTRIKTSGQQPGTAQPLVTPAQLISWFTGRGP